MLCLLLSQQTCKRGLQKQACGLQKRHQTCIRGLQKCITNAEGACKRGTNCICTLYIYIYIFLLSHDTCRRDTSIDDAWPPQHGTAQRSTKMLFQSRDLARNTHTRGDNGGEQRLLWMHRHVSLCVCVLVFACVCMYAMSAWS